MALPQQATGRNQKRGGFALSRFFGLLAGIWLLSASYPAVAQDRFVRVTGLSDVNFGLITNFGVDARRSQSLCLFSGRPGLGYNVRAFGSGLGGVFTLASGSDKLKYDVQWNMNAGQTSGTQLTPNATLTGLISNAAQQTCSNGPPTSASLILIIRATELTGAAGGNFSGTLNLVIGPE